MRLSFSKVLVHAQRRSHFVSHLSNSKCVFKELNIQCCNEMNIFEYIFKNVIFCALLWKCVSNVCLLVCFYKNRKNKWGTFLTNILLLTVTAVAQSVTVFALRIFFYSETYLGIYIVNICCKTFLTLFASLVALESLQMTFMFKLQVNAILRQKRIILTTRRIICTHVILLVASLLVVVAGYGFQIKDIGHDINVHEDICSLGTVLDIKHWSLVYLAICMGLPGVVCIMMYIFVFVSYGMQISRSSIEIPPSKYCNTPRKNVENGSIDYSSGSEGSSGHTSRMEVYTIDKKVTTSKNSETVDQINGDAHNDTEIQTNNDELNVVLGLSKEEISGYARRGRRQTDFSNGMPDKALSYIKRAMATLGIFLCLNTILPVQFLITCVVSYIYQLEEPVVYSTGMLLLSNIFNVIVLVKCFKQIQDGLKTMFKDFMKVLCCNTCN